MKLDLPFWSGIKDERAVNKETFVFELSVDSEKLIKQSTDEQILNLVHKNYSDEDYGYITPPPGESLWASSTITARFELIRCIIEDFSNKHILDIGAANTYLGRSVTESYNVGSYTVVDPSISEAGESNKLHVIRDYFSSSLVGSKKYDLIFSFSCLEHVPDARQFLSDIASVLSEDGDFFCYFPVIDQQFKRGDLNAILHEHITYFTVDSAKYTFSQLGFKIIDISIKNDGAWVHAKKLPEPINNIIIKDNPLLLIECFEKSVYNNVKRLKSIFSRIKGDMLFYGACNGLNTLASFFPSDITDRMIVCDGCITKKGKYLPNIANPIVFKNDVLFDDYETIFIAAMSFYDEIVADLNENFEVEKNKIVPVFL